jgi:hypothetical protein
MFFLVTKSIKALLYSEELLVNIRPPFSHFLLKLLPNIFQVLSFRGERQRQRERKRKRERDPLEGEREGKNLSSAAGTSRGRSRHRNISGNISGS